MFWTDNILAVRWSFSLNRPVSRFSAGRHQNRRPEYIETFWKVVNWEFVADRYAKLKA